MKTPITELLNGLGYEPGESLRKHLTKPSVIYLIQLRKEMAARIEFRRAQYFQQSGSKRSHVAVS